MKARIATVGLAHPFEIGFSNAQELLDQTSDALCKVGVDCIRTGVVMSNYATVEEAAKILKGIDFDVALICVATWSEDNLLLDLLSFIDVPVIIRAFPHRETGSLCCAHQIGAVFTEINKDYEFVYGDASSADCAVETEQIAKAYALVNKMSKFVTGAIGGRVQGMTEIAYDEFDIKEKLGARVVNIDEAEMVDAAKNASEADVKKVMENLESRGFKISSCKQDLEESSRYYLALKSLVDEYRLSSLAVKCYTKYMGKVCVGYSLLAEDGVMCSCEGDVTNSLSMQILYELSGKPVNNTDLLYLNEEDNTILYAHCGSSGFAIADREIEIGPVRLAETGCCSLFTAMPGKVTLLNAVGHGDKFRLSTMVGDAVSCEMEFPGNPVKVKHDKPVLEISNSIMKNGIGHHWMVGYGDYSDVIKRFCKIQNINYFGL